MRNNDRIELGVSPRGALALARMSKAAAYVEGREYVLRFLELIRL